MKVQVLKRVATFAVVLLAMITLCTTIWQAVVVEYLYDCTDVNLIGFLRPGGWVHFDHGVVYVPHVTHSHSMSDPDSIRQGWNMTYLWCLWFSLVAISAATSFFVANRRSGFGRMLG